MKKLALIITAMLISACGTTLKVDMGTLKVEHTIKLGEIRDVFQLQCSRTLGTAASGLQIEECTTQKLAEFLGDYSNVTSKSSYGG